MTTTSEREEVLAGLADSVWKLDAAMATQFANRAVAIGMDAYEAINDGLAKGMMVVSGKFDRRVLRSRAAARREGDEHRHRHPETVPQGGCQHAQGHGGHRDG
jgi:hypothetical protein